MDFLKDLTLPQSFQHMTLLHFIHALVYLIFLPYLSLLIGSSLTSLYFLSRGRKKGDGHALRYAKEVIDITIVNRGSLLVLGVIPFLSLLLIYTQLLHLADTIVVGTLSFSFLLFVLALFLLDSYKFTFTLRSLIDNLTARGTGMNNSKSLNEEIRSFSEANVSANYQRGIWGTIMLIFSLILFVAATTLLFDPISWNSVGSVFTLIFTPFFWSRFFQILLLSLAISGTAAGFFLFKWRKEEKRAMGEYGENLRSFLFPKILVTLLLLPVILLLDLFSIPRESLSAIAFGSVLSGVLFIFVIVHFLYAMIRESHTKFVSYAFFLLLGLFFFLSLRDTVSLANATRSHSVLLAREYKIAEDELKAKLGLEIASVSGEDIFVGKCSACHSFDKRLVGPAYIDILPKYEGKEGELAQFILNPRKIDPAFPPMPAQGLKPSDAKKVAEYLMKRSKGEK